MTPFPAEILWLEDRPAGCPVPERVVSDSNGIAGCRLVSSLLAGSCPFIVPRSYLLGRVSRACRGQNFAKSGETLSKIFPSFSQKEPYVSPRAYETHQ